MSELIIEAADGTFEQEVLKAEKPVLIDFWAQWCGPCRAMSPIVEEIASERTDIKVVKVNVDDCPAVSNEYGIMSIPTFMIFKNGEAAAEQVGSIGKAGLNAFIDGQVK